MLLNRKIFFLLLTINIVISNPIFNSSLHEKYKLAEAYSESNLYDDAIIIYEEILQIQEDVLGDADLNLLNTVSKLYMNGTLRSWIHYIELRAANGTQKEHMDIANACAEVIHNIFPMGKKLN